MEATIEHSVEAGIAAAEARYRAGAFAEAATILQPLAEDHPNHAGLLRLLGLCRVRLRDLSAGLDLLQRACTLAPDDPYARLHLGIGLHEAGRLDAAAALFRTCARDLPNDPAPSLNLAAALLQLDDIPGARRAARRARLLAPQLPEAHYTLGLVLLAAGVPARAADCFAIAARLDPRFADAWVNLGLAQYRQLDIHAAIASMRRALAADPTHRAAAANLGAFLRLTGSVEESERLLQATIARDPAAAEARANLAAGLLQEERAAEALALLDGELPSESGLRRHWQAQRSLALLQLGRAAEARAIVQQIEAGAPPDLPLLWRRVLLALAEERPAEARAAAEQMERLLAQAEGAVPEHRIMAHFDLAKFWSGLGEADRAFPLWVRGHALLGRLQPFSRDACRAFVDASVAHFDRARLHGGVRAANRDPAPVFIVGMPRSGTPWPSRSSPRTLPRSGPANVVRSARLLPRSAGIGKAPRRWRASPPSRPTRSIAWQNGIWPSCTHSQPRRCA
jgi:tetratricopeptide (TPR) repeat protein